MKLHLPLSLRTAVLLATAGLYSQAHAADTPLVLESGQELNLTGNTGGLQSPLILSDGILSIDYSNATAPASLNGNALSLSGGTALHLIPGTATDGRVINLLTNVGTLYGTDGTPLVLNEQNNAAANYFDTTQSGTGYWANATLQLSDSGTLQLVLHREKVKEALQVTTRQEGGADYQYYEGVTFSDIKTGSTDSNVYGGAIYGGADSTITLSNNGIVNFRGNTVSYDSNARGGAICGDTITLNNNGSVTFNENSVNASEYASGGAINGNFAYSTITLNNNDSVTFSRNSTSNSYDSHGGAIHGAYGSTITLSGNRFIHFNNNTAGSYGGAIALSGETGNITINNNARILFVKNEANYGGAIYIYNRGQITIDNNTSVIFGSNKGGAVHAYQGYLSLLSNNFISFSGNECSNGRGALYGMQITLNNNEIVHFKENKSINGSSSIGGAISSDDLNSVITMCDNGTVIFSKNTVTTEWATTPENNALGGAIFAYGDLFIRNNDSVLFEKNAETEKNESEFVQLRSIYCTAQSEGKIFSLSAPADKSIEFRDSLYIDSNPLYTNILPPSVQLNANYADTNGVIHKQTGDIIFTGAYTEAHLMEMKGGVAGTAEEIQVSRTSEVYALTNLYGGRLRVEDGAIYKGRGITVHEGSAATLMLKNGELNHAGYDITISSGSTLSALGESTIAATTLAIQDGGTMQLALDMSQTDSAAVLTTTGNLSMNNLSFNLTGTEYLVKGDYKLLTRTEGTDYDISGWTLNGVTSEQLRWENGTLYYTGGHDWNHGVTDDDDISDLEEILGNLIINGGDVTLEAVVGAIQDAVDAGFGHGQGHIVINRGGIHITGAGDLDGHIIFNGDLKAIRKLFIEKDITGITIELGGNSQAENIVDVGDGHTMEIDSLSGSGSMNKTGKGEMVVHGNGHKVGGTLRVQEGTLTFTVANDTSGEAAETETEVHELVVGNKKDKEAKVKVDKDTMVKGNKMQVDGQHAVVTNNGTMEFTEEVKVKNGHLDNQGSISKVTLEGGKVSGSGTFAGLEMLGGELVVGNSPGLQTYTDDVELTKGEVTFSLADTETAATADTHGWGTAAYSTIDMGGNDLMLSENVNFVLEIGGAALESLVAADGASLTFSLSLIQNIGAESLTLDSDAFAALLGNTSIMITSDAEGLSADALYLAGRDITALLSDSSYGYEGNTLVFKGTVTNDGSLTIPEPSTATLSLLALAALAARRRRR